MNPSAARTNPLSKLFIYLFLGLGTLCYLYPLFWLAINSFKKTSEIFASPWALPAEWMWKNYVKAFATGGTGRYLFNSTYVTGVTLVLVLIIGSMGAFALVKLKWKASKITLVYILLGMMVPIHATLIPLFVLFSKIHLVNSHLGLILIYTSGGLPLAILILCGFISSIPRELLEAAVIDGCSIYGVYWRVLLPVIKPALMTVAIFSFVSNWNELLVALVFVSDTKLMTLPVGLTNFQGQYATDFAPMFAAIVMATLPTIVICSFFSKRIMSGMTAGSLKG
jgi:raffinose/stachyose/melibiose transport system permease protein